MKSKPTYQQSQTVCLSRAWKESGEPVEQLLYDIFNITWEVNIVPAECNHSVMCSISKGKFIPTEYKNFRGISFLSHVGKLCEGIFKK